MTLLKTASNADLRNLLQEFREMGACESIKNFKKSDLLKSLIDEEMDKGDYMNLGVAYNNVQNMLTYEVVNRFEKNLL